MHKYLTKEVLPSVYEAEEERKALQIKLASTEHQQQVAVIADRKRSSRIAFKESEVEEKMRGEREEERQNRRYVRMSRRSGNSVKELVDGRNGARRTRKQEKEDTALLEAILRNSIENGFSRTNGIDTPTSDQESDMQVEDEAMTPVDPSADIEIKITEPDEGLVEMLESFPIIEKQVEEPAIPGLFHTLQDAYPPPREDPKILDPNVETNPGPGRQNGSARKQAQEESDQQIAQQGIDFPRNAITDSSFAPSNSPAKSQTQTAESSSAPRAPAKEEPQQEAQPAKATPAKKGRKPAARGKKRKKSESDSEPDFIPPLEMFEDDYDGRSRRPRRSAAAKPKVQEPPPELPEEEPVSEAESQQSSSSSFALPEDKSDTDFVPSDDVCFSYKLFDSGSIESRINPRKEVQKVVHLLVEAATLPQKVDNHQLLPTGLNLVHRA